MVAGRARALHVSGRHSGSPRDGAARAELAANWRVVLGSFLGVAGGFSSLFFYSVGLFLLPLSAEFGWTRGEASLQTVAIAVANLIAVPVAGRVVDRFGPLRPALVSMLALGAGFVALGTLTQGLLSFLVISGLATAASAASNPVSFNRILVARFKKARGLALGLALTAIGVGASLLPLALAPLIAQRGWHFSYFLLAAVTVPLAVGAWFYLRNAEERPEGKIGPSPVGDVLLSRPFLTIATLIFLIAVPVLGTVVHLVPMLGDRGFDATSAGLVASALGVAVIAGRLVTGWLLDIFDAGWVTAAVLTLTALGMLLLYSGVHAVIVPGAAFAGMGLGCESDLIAFLVARRFPLVRFGTAYGFVYAAHVMGAGLGPALAGALFDHFGNYQAWLLAATTCLLGAAALALFTERGSSIPADLSTLPLAAQ